MAMGYCFHCPFSRYVLFLLLLLLLVYPAAPSSTPVSISDDIEEEEHSSSSTPNTFFNFASHAAGAVILDKSPKTAKGYNNLLTDDKDKYAISPCNEKKWIVIGLSEDILITSVKVANYEKYSSVLKDFQLLAATSYPADQWIDLGTFTALQKLGEQQFNITEETSAHTRYLKFRFLTHYLDEDLCTLSQIKVHGTTVIASFKEEVDKSNDLLELLDHLNDDVDLTDTADNFNAIDVVETNDSKENVISPELLADVDAAVCNNKSAGMEEGHTHSSHNICGSLEKALTSAANSTELIDPDEQQQSENKINSGGSVYHNRERNSINNSIVQEHKHNNAATASSSSERSLINNITKEGSDLPVLLVEADDRRSISSSVESNEGIHNSAGIAATPLKEKESSDNEDMILVTESLVQIDNDNNDDDPSPHSSPGLTSAPSSSPSSANANTNVLAGSHGAEPSSITEATAVEQQQQSLDSHNKSESLSPEEALDNSGTKENPTIHTTIAAVDMHRSSTSSSGNSVSDERNLHTDSLDELVDDEHTRPNKQIRDDPSISGDSSEEPVVIPLYPQTALSLSSGASSDADNSLSIEGGSRDLDSSTSNSSTTANFSTDNNNDDDDDDNNNSIHKGMFGKENCSENIVEVNRSECISANVVIDVPRETTFFNSMVEIMTAPIADIFHSRDSPSAASSTVVIAEKESNKTISVNGGEVSKLDRIEIADCKKDGSCATEAKQTLVYPDDRATTNTDDNGKLSAPNSDDESTRIDSKGAYTSAGDGDSHGKVNIAAGRTTVQGQDSNRQVGGKVKDRSLDRLRELENFLLDEKKVTALDAGEDKTQPPSSAAEKDNGGYKLKNQNANDLSREKEQKTPMFSTGQLGPAASPLAGDDADTERGLSDNLTDQLFTSDGLVPAAGIKLVPESESFDAATGSTSSGTSRSNNNKEISVEGSGQSIHATTGNDARMVGSVSERVLGGGNDDAHTSSTAKTENNLSKEVNEENAPQNLTSVKESNSSSSSRDVGSFDDNESWKTLESNPPVSDFDSATPPLSTEGDKNNNPLTTSSIVGSHTEEEEDDAAGGILLSDDSSSSSNNNEEIVSTLEFSCLQNLKFIDFQSKMKAKLQQKSSAAANATNSSDSVGGGDLSKDVNLFRSLMKKIKTLETNNAIVEMYTAQMSDCYQSVLKELLQRYNDEHSAKEDEAALSSSTDTTAVSSVLAVVNTSKLSVLYSRVKRVGPRVSTGVKRLIASVSLFSSRISSVMTGSTTAADMSGVRDGGGGGSSISTTIHTSADNKEGDVVQFPVKEEGIAVGEEGNRGEDGGATATSRRDTVILGEHTNRNRSSSQGNYHYHSERAAIEVRDKDGVFYAMLLG